MLEEVFFISMNSLLRAIIPAGINPFLARTVLPGPKYLSNNWLSKIIWIPDMNPITYDGAWVSLCYLVSG